MTVPIQTRAFRLMWADRIALAAAAIFLALFALVVLLVFVATGMLGTTHLIQSMGLRVIGYTVLIAGSLWIAMRAVDFALGGRTYKLFTAAAPQTTVPFPMAQVPPAPAHPI